MRSRLPVIPVGLLLLCVVPLFVHDDYVLHILIIGGIYALLTISLNLLVGCAGMFSLGHAAFYGLGAYFTARR